MVCAKDELKQERRQERGGMTGDYLSVLPADPALPRGARFDARLVAEQGRLLAIPLTDD